MNLRFLLATLFLLGSISAPAFTQRAGGDNCDDPLEVVLDGSTLPFAWGNETTCGRGNDYDNTCLGYYDGGEDFILKFDLPVLMSVMITLYPNGTSSTGMLVSDHCPPDGNCIASSTRDAAGSHSLIAPYLDAGIYYVMVDTWPSPDCIPQFDLQIEEIFVDNPGINCSFPAPIDLSPQYLPVLIEDNSTCGFEDDYENTCLGEYDGGEDMLFELHVTMLAFFDIIIDPHGATWTGIVIDDVCPPAPEDCIAMSTSSSAQVHGLWAVELDSGRYYLMVDTWPSPDCIPQFDIFIDDPFHHQMGDDCDLPQYLILPDDLPFTFSHQYTWGRGDDYNNTCLGEYDEGEDFIVQLEVYEEVTVDISLEPQGYPGTAFALSDECPPGAECIASSTNDAATTHGVEGVNLPVGIYYLMVDCNAGTGTIDDFNLLLELSEPAWLCGDANADETVNVTDAVYLISYIFAGGLPPDPLAAGDVNCDETVNISDVVYLMDWIFGFPFPGPPPCDPNGDGVPDC